MMNFLVLTLSITVAVLLSSVIMTVIMFKLSSNTKVINWITKYYLKQIEKITENFEKSFEDLGA